MTTRKQLKHSTAKQLIAACKDLGRRLEGWVEVANAEDLRHYDTAALQKGRNAIAKAEQELTQ